MRSTTLPVQTPSPTLPAADDGLDLRERIVESENLLYAAAKRGVSVPPEVKAAIISSRRAYDDGSFDGETELAFAEAYSLLHGAVEPARRVRRRYRATFWLALVLMLVAQLYYVLAGEVHGRLTEMREQAYRLGTELQEKTQAAAGESATRDLVWQAKKAADQVTTYRTFANWLLPLPLAVDGDDGARLAALRIVVDFLAVYVLPTVYGLLGACAFVLRQLSGEIGRFQYAQEFRARYTLRLHIGLLGGLAVGWFVTPGEADSVLNLSPLALAFVAGYSSDLLFAALDRVVGAFNGGAKPAQVPAPAAA